MDHTHFAHSLIRFALLVLMLVGFLVFAGYMQTRRRNSASVKLAEQALRNRATEADIFDYKVPRRGPDEKGHNYALAIQNMLLARQWVATLNVEFTMSNITADVLAEADYKVGEAEDLVRLRLYAITPSDIPSVQRRIDVAGVVPAEQFATFLAIETAIAEKAPDAFHAHAERLLALLRRYESGQQKAP